MPAPLNASHRAHTGRPSDGGSVRRARQQAGAGLTYFPYESGDESVLAQNGSSPPGVNRSISQTSGHWAADSQRHTAQDILQHPLMSQSQRSPPRSPASGELTPDFRFPQVPAPAQTSQRRNRDYVPPPSRRPGPNYRTPAQVSPIVEEDQEPSLRARSAYSHASTGLRSSGILHSDSKLNLHDEYDYESIPASTPANTPYLPQFEEQPIVRQASLGKSAKPAIKNIKTWGADQHTFRADKLQRQQTSTPPPLPPQQQQQPPPQSRQATINALSAAVAAVAAEDGHPAHPAFQPQVSRTNAGGLRMPFESATPPLSPEHERGIDELHPPQNSSTRSRSPLLATQFPPHQPSMSDRIPSGKRPPKLDMEAVHANDRSSTTSLADLIRRATKLAANLDRGRTASRLGLLDMFYGDEKGKRRDPNEKRTSGISDMLSAFPTVGTPNKSQSNLDKWPDDGVRMERQPSKRKGKKGRRCCGLSLPALMIILLVLVVLIAAAVLLPLFLIVFPRNKNNSAPAVTVESCQNSFRCQHGGQSVVVAGSCSCVCVGSHTGSHCASADSTQCAITDVSGIRGATMGNDVPDLLQRSLANFSVPLDSAVILGVFSMEGMTCDLENSLISFSEFGTASTRRSKRFYPLRFAEEELKILEASHTTSGHVQAHTVLKRQPSPTSSSNGIVFQATSTSVPMTEVPATSAAAGAGTATSSGPSPSSTPSSSSGVSIPARTLNFARVVVLYVLEQSATLSVALNAQQLLKSQLLAGDIQNVIEVGFGSLDLRADLKGEKILWGNGTVVGGGPSA